MMRKRGRSLHGGFPRTRHVDRLEVIIVDKSEIGNEMRMILIGKTDDGGQLIF